MTKYSGYLVGNYTSGDSSLPRLELIDWVDGNPYTQYVELQPGNLVSLIASEPSNQTKKICPNKDFHILKEELILKNKDCKECQNVACFKLCKFGFDNVPWRTCGTCLFKHESLTKKYQLYIAGFNENDTPLKIGISEDPERRNLNNGFSFYALPQWTTKSAILETIPVMAFLEWLLPHLNSQRQVNQWSLLSGLTSVFNASTAKRFIYWYKENTNELKLSDSLLKFQNKFKKVWEPIKTNIDIIIQRSSSFESFIQQLRRFIYERKDEDIIYELEGSKFFKENYQHLLHVILADLLQINFKIYPLNYHENVNPEIETSVDLSGFLDVNDINLRFFSRKQEFDFQSSMVIANRGQLMLLKEDNDFTTLKWDREGLGRYITLEVI